MVDVMNTAEQPTVSTGSDAPDEQSPEPVVVVMLGPAPDRATGNLSVALGVVNLVAGGFLIVMFVSLAQGGSTAPWGPINDALAAAGNILLTLVLPRISRNAARSRLARGFVRATAVASLVSAVSGLLLVVRVLPFEPSTAISMVAIVLQCAWMLWLSRTWARDPRVPAAIWRFGLIAGLGLLAGMVLVGASLLLPFGSTAANLLLIPGVAGGGVAWLAWPLWYVLLGRHLRRTDAAR